MEKIFISKRVAEFHALYAEYKKCFTYDFPSEYEKNKHIKKIICKIRIVTKKLKRDAIIIDAYSRLMELSYSLTPILE